MDTGKRAGVMRATDATFDLRVLAAGRPVLVHFWAPWHAPCLAVKNRLEALAPRFCGKVELFGVNLAENPRLATRYCPSGAPALVFIRDGEVVRTLPPNALTGQRLERVLEGHARARADPSA